MINSLKKILFLLTLKQKKKSLFFLILLLFSTILEGISLALIFPLVKIISDKEYLLELNSKLPILNLISVEPEKIITVIILVTLLIYFLKTSYLIFFSWWKSKFILHINNNISERLFTKYIHSPYEYFFNKNSAEFVRNVYGESRYINLFIDALLKVLVETFSILIVMAVLLSIEFKITIFTFLLFMFLGFIFNIFFTQKIKNLSFKKQNFVGKTFQSMNQSFGLIKEILIRGNQNFFSSEFKNSLRNVNSSSQLLMFISEIPKNIIEIIFVTIVCTVFFIGYKITTNFNELIPTMALFGVATIRILPAFNRLITCKQNIDSCYPSIKIIYDELKNEPSSNNHSKQLKNENIEYTFKENLKFQNISYKYPKTKNPIFKNLNLIIKKNACICFVGESGSGKTTLVDIISGLLKPDTGKILLDGKELELCNNGWRRNIGYVSQSTYLIDDTIKNNILFGANNFSSEPLDIKRFNRALEYSQLNALIKNLPESVDYNVGENGIKLSGGQRQRVGIARALYFEPKILILDEITSSLDDSTSEELLESLNLLSGKITIIYVSHNEKVIKNADITLNLSKGKNGETIIEEK